MTRPRVDTDQVRAWLVREPARAQGCARLIRVLCDEIDRLRGQVRLAVLARTVPRCPSDDP